MLREEVLSALKAERHLRGPLVFCTADGRMLRKNEGKHPLWRAVKLLDGLDRISEKLPGRQLGDNAKNLA